MILSEGYYRGEQRCCCRRLIGADELGAVDAVLAHGRQGCVEGGPGDAEDAVEPVAVVGEGDAFAFASPCHGEGEEDEALLDGGSREASHLVPDSGAEEVLLCDVCLQFALHQQRYAHGLLEGCVRGCLPCRAGIAAGGYLLLCGRNGVDHLRVGIRARAGQEEEGEEAEPSAHLAVASEVPCCGKSRSLL